jgi:hypothetical protein
MRGMAMIRHDTGKQESPVPDDDVLREMYVTHNLPCDRLVSDPETLLAFTQAYTDRTGQEIEPAQVSHRLLTLRKIGEAKGGLPKLRRKYNGRN